MVVVRRGQVLADPSDEGVTDRAEFRRWAMPRVWQMDVDDGTRYMVVSIVLSAKSRSDLPGWVQLALDRV
jgi:hypothetical protein